MQLRRFMFSIRDAERKLVVLTSHSLSLLGGSLLGLGHLQLLLLAQRRVVIRLLLLLQRRLLLPARLVERQPDLLQLRSANKQSRTQASDGKR